MGEFADSAAVQLAWGQPIPDGSIAHVDYLIDKAERLVRASVRNLDALLVAGPLTPGDVSDVVCDMVLRVLKNPDGYRYETAGDYAVQRDASVAGGVMVLQAAEKARLRGSTGEVTSVPVGDNALRNPHRRDWCAERRHGGYGIPLDTYGYFSDPV
jgi:hypothetical protein